MVYSKLDENVFPQFFSITPIKSNAMECCSLTIKKKGKKNWGVEKKTRRTFLKFQLLKLTASKIKKKKKVAASERKTN